MKSGADSSKTRGTDASTRNELTPGLSPDSAALGRPALRPSPRTPCSCSADFRALRFAAPLEAEFREVHLAETLPQIRRNLWLAIASSFASPVSPTSCWTRASTGRST